MFLLDNCPYEMTIVKTTSNNWMNRLRFNFGFYSGTIRACNVKNILCRDGTFMEGDSVLFANNRIYSLELYNLLREHDTNLKRKFIGVPLKRKPEPYGDVAKYDRFYYHPESDSYWVLAKGELYGGIDMECSVELDESEWEKRKAIQEKRRGVN